MKLFIARDKNGQLNLFKESKPVFYEPSGWWLSDCNFFKSVVPSELLPSVTWENSPQEVELTLVDDHIDGILTVFKALNCRQSWLEKHPNISRWDKEYKECSELLEKVKQIIENLK